MNSSSTNLVQNLQLWLDANKEQDKQSIDGASKLMKDDSQIKVYYIGDRDERNYFHMQEAEELYYVFKGQLILRCLDCTGVSKDIHIMEGETFLLPSRILHCVRKCENLCAIMFERERLSNEMDNLSWFAVDNRDRPFTSNEDLPGHTSHGDGKSQQHNQSLGLSPNPSSSPPPHQLSPPHILFSSSGVMTINESSLYDDDSDIQRSSLSGDPFVPLAAIKKRSPSVISNAENYHCTTGPHMKLLKETWFHCYNVFSDVPKALEALKGRPSCTSPTQTEHPSSDPLNKQGSPDNNSGGGQVPQPHHPQSQSAPFYRPCHDLEDDIHPPIALDLWIERHRPEIQGKGCVSLFDEDDYQVKVMVYGAGEHIGRNNVADIFVWQYTGTSTFKLNDDDTKTYDLNRMDVVIVPRGSSYTAVNQPNALTLHIVIDPRKKSS